jgi:copper chaperone CopZ
MNYTLHVEGMHCPSCEKMVRMMIEDIDSVTINYISHQTGEVVITCEESLLPAIKKAISNAGYSVSN